MNVFDLISDGRIADLEEYIQNGGDINVSLNQTTPLNAAISRKSIDFVESLLEAGADTEGTDSCGLTALHAASTIASLQDTINSIFGFVEDAPETRAINIKTQLEYVTLLVKHRADIEKRTRHGFSPLLSSISDNQPKMVELCLMYGADPNTTNDNGETMLTYAIDNNSDIDIIKILLNAGVDNNMCNIHGLTPLHVALNRHRFDVAKLLIESDADINAMSPASETPLNLAIINGSEEISRLLIEKGAHVSTHIDSLLFDAIKHSRGLDLIKLILEHSNDVKVRNGRLLLNTALDKNYPFKLFSMIIDIIQNLHEMDGSLQNPLFTAIRRNRIDVMNLLLDKGFNIQTRNDEGATPLHIAAMKDSHDLCKFLLDHGADMGATDIYGKIPYSYLGDTNNPFTKVKLMFKEHVSNVTNVN